MFKKLNILILLFLFTLSTPVHATAFDVLQQKLKQEVNKAANDSKNNTAQRTKKYVSGAKVIPEYSIIDNLHSYHDYDYWEDF